VKYRSAILPLMRAVKWKEHETARATRPLRGEHREDTVQSSKFWLASIVSIGILNIVFFAAGIWYTAITVRGFLAWKSTHGWSTPHFPAVFIAMTSINAILLLSLAYSGICLLQLRRAGVILSNIVFASELIWFLLVQGLLALTPSLISSSVGAAGGVGNMGIAPQILTGYPVVALIVLNLADRKERKPSPAI
jgi:magnesium-transporting ATPase (P-type)